MSTFRVMRWSLAAMVLGLPLLAGCGGGSDANSAGKGQPGAAEERGLPTVSVGTGKARTPLPSDPEAEFTPPKEGTAQWFVWELLNLRAQPLPETTEADALSAARAERNREIVSLATQAIAKSHSDAELEEFFNEAVHHLMEARLQLAIAGDRDEIDALYEDAASLQQRDPKSVAAAEAAFAKVRLAHSIARRQGTQDARWLQEFARQTRAFAGDFPEQELRSLPLLFSAAATCDLHGLAEDAIACYALLEDKFPQTPQALQASAALRRLNLRGRQLELSGPTLDGGKADIADYRGRVVLVAFWSSDSTRCVEQIAQWAPVVRKYEKYGVAVLGVNLDAEEPAIDAFLEKNALPGVHVFHADRAKRRWNNPLVQHYGVRDIPALWLVDQQGTVTDTQVDPEKLEGQLRQLLSRKQTAAGT